MEGRPVAQARLAGLSGIRIYRPTPGSRRGWGRRGWLRGDARATAPNSPVAKPLRRGSPAL